MFKQMDTKIILKMCLSEPVQQDKEIQALHIKKIFYQLTADDNVILIKKTVYIYYNIQSCCNRRKKTFYKKENRFIFKKLPHF